MKLLNCFLVNFVETGRLDNLTILTLASIFTGPSEGGSSEKITTKLPGVLTGLTLQSLSKNSVSCKKYLTCNNPMLNWKFLQYL